MFKSISLEDLPRLNSHLETRAYMAGFVPSLNDHIMYTHVCSMDVAPEMHHVLRWLSHMKSFSQAERAALPAKGRYAISPRQRRSRRLRNLPTQISSEATASQTTRS